MDLDLVNVNDLSFIPPGTTDLLLHLRTILVQLVHALPPDQDSAQMCLLLCADLHAVQEKINQRNAKIHDLTLEKKLLAQKLADKETTAGQTKSELERALAANDELEEENDELREENEWLREENDELKAENDELKAENAGLKEENDLLEILLKDLLPTLVGPMRQRELGNSSGNSSDMSDVDE